MKAKTKPAKKTAAKKTAPKKAAIAAAPAVKMIPGDGDTATCPICRQPPGKPCKDEKGRSGTWMHSGRVTITYGEKLGTKNNFGTDQVPTSERKGVPVAKPLDLATLKAPGRLEQLDPAKIDVNPHNPRRQEVDEKAQAEFEDSIATQGILEPVLVRPRPAGAGQTGRAPYELVAGERRFKAALKAIAAKKLPADYRIPSMVKELDNRQARLVALAENIARADMHPLDECREFAAAEDAGSTPAEIVKATGAHLRNVQRRIKTWRDLPEAGKTAFAADKISFSQAHAIAQVPEDLRETVLREVLRGGQWMNEDWIGRRWKSIKRSRARAKEQRAADKKDPKAAADRKAGNRSHDRARALPKPDKDGVFAWPKKTDGYRDGVDRQAIDGAVVKLELVAITVDDKREVFGFRVKAGPIEHIEPLRVSAAVNVAKDKDPMRPHERRAVEYLIDKVLGAPASATTLDRRKVATDITAVIDELLTDAAYYEPQRKEKAKLLERLHDKLLQVLAPPAAKPEPSPLARDRRERVVNEVETRITTGGRQDGAAAPDGPLAAPVELPGKTPEIGRGMFAATVKGLVLVAGLNAEHSRHASAKAADLPDYVLVERDGRFFAYAFNHERGAEKPPKAAPGKPDVLTRAPKPANDKAAAPAAAAE